MSILLQQLQIPSLYKDAPEDARYAGYYYRLITELMYETRENSVLLVDSQGAVVGDMRRAIEAWPIKYRKRAETMLAYLDRHHRLVSYKSQSGPAHASMCDESGCQHAYSIAITLASLSKSGFRSLG